MGLSRGDPLETPSHLIQHRRLQWPGCSDNHRGAFGHTGPGELVVVPAASGVVAARRPAAVMTVATAGSALRAMKSSRETGSRRRQLGCSLTVPGTFT